MSDNPTPKGNGHQRIFRAPLIPFVPDRDDSLDPVSDRQRAKSLDVPTEEASLLSRLGVTAKQTAETVRIVGVITPYLFATIWAFVMKNPTRIIGSVLGLISVLVLEIWDIELSEEVIKWLQVAITGGVAALWPSIIKGKTEGK
jgi:hypothetical protein